MAELFETNQEREQVRIPEWVLTPDEEGEKAEARRHWQVRLGIVLFAALIIGLFLMLHDATDLALDPAMFLAP
ncbi:MAG TPA: hypothetical protein VKY65_03025 [Alphaproteobacteria bacterium]|nr:hypothetical protein [Alphaproteobacteria bacterium]